MILATEIIILFVFGIVCMVCFIAAWKETGKTWRD